MSEVTGADDEHLGLERGHRTLTVTRKDGKVITIPLAPRTARTIDLAIGERTDGPLFVTADGRRLDRHLLLPGRDRYAAAAARASVRPWMPRSVPSPSAAAPWWKKTAWIRYTQAVCSARRSW